MRRHAQSCVGTIRRCDADTDCYEWPIPGLPLLLVYVIDVETLRIVALFHTSRDPATRRHR